MGGSKSQTVGYTYFKGLMAVIGNPIERFLGINPDKKGWLMLDNQSSELPQKQQMVVIKPNLFGGEKKEGGWVGLIDIYLGRDNQEQNEYLAHHIDEDVSAYPNQSYLVFRGYNPITQNAEIDKGFQLVSMSGMMKEFMVWVKRTRIKNDGSRQWYEIRPSDQAIVCEIGGQNFIGNLEKFKSDIESTKWLVEDKNLGIVSTGDALTTESYFNFSTGRDIGAIGRIFANVNFTQPTYNGFFFVRGRADDEGELSVSNAKVHKLKDKIIPSYGKEYEWLVEINNGTLSLEIDFKIKNLYIAFHEGGVVVDFSSEIPIDDNFKTPGYDINPIHKIREILTDYTAMGKPESEINDENFKLMADRIFDEGLGISWCIQQKSCKEALEELEYHIEGGVRINRQTGLYEVILFRDDLLNLDDALHFDESNIKSFQPDIINAEDQINAVNVSFYDRENIKDSSFSLSDVGSFHTIDHENAEDLKFPYFMNRRNAEMVANWKLKQLSTMAWKGTFTTGKYEARKLNKYDVVLLSWKSKNIVNLPVRVMNINLGNGRDNTVTLDFVEVVPYSNISYSSINVDPNPNPILPPQPNSSIVFEMPYLEAVQRMGQTSVDAELINNPEIGYLMAAAIKPQNNSLNALLFTDGGTGIYTNFEESGVVEYCAACSLDQNISYTDTSFAIKSVKDISRVKLGTLVQADDELFVYQNYDTETKVLTVKRGALDTIPKPHLKDAVFYFWDDSSGLDSTSYVEGETIKAQVLTTTPSGIENLDPGNVQSLEIVGRANRPYPPANVKINGEYWLDEIENDLVLTWVDRNRVQQTGGDILGWFDSGVTLESDVNYQLILIEYDENNIVLRTQNLNLGTINTYTFENSSMNTNTRYIEINLNSIRAGFESYQSFTHIVKLNQFFSAPYDITYIVRDT
ncbi:phage tail protein [Acinetobacter bereziniae]|uniref:phage tail protein n=1 Tax=Acinetobacter bereziniae TaxID=106648 RepID=UPI00125F23B9|nr:phage tail protein [Acinetobacter bereziniae]